MVWCAIKAWFTKRYRMKDDSVAMGQLASARAIRCSLDVITEGGSGSCLCLLDRMRRSSRAARVMSTGVEIYKEA